MQQSYNVFFISHSKFCIFLHLGNIAEYGSLWRKPQKIDFLLIEGVKFSKKWDCQLKVKNLGLWFAFLKFFNVNYFCVIRRGVIKNGRNSWLILYTPKTHLSRIFASKRPQKCNFFCWKRVPLRKVFHWFLIFLK